MAQAASVMQTAAPRRAAPVTVFCHQSIGVYRGSRAANRFLISPTPESSRP